MTSFATKQTVHVDDTASFITFSVGQALFALPVNAIKYITSANAIKTHDTPDSQKRMHKVFDFNGQPIELYSFSQIIGSDSQAANVAELITLLDQREQDHISWIKALEHSIVTGEEFTKATDPHQCAFGMWYDHYTSDDNELAQIMTRFDAPHKRIHSLAEKLLNLAQSQDGIKKAISIRNDEKTSTLKELIRIFGMARSRLEDLLKPVILIIQKDSLNFAIELDNIGGIKDFCSTDWLPAIQEHSHTLSCNDGFYQASNNELYLKLCPEKILTVIQKKQMAQAI